MARKDFSIIESSGKEIKLSVRAPSYEDYEESDRVRAAKIASQVREKKGKKLLLRNELDKFLRESGIWTDLDEKRISELQKEIEALLNKIRQGGQKLGDGRKYCIEVMDKRKEIVKIASKRQLFDDSTIESAADTEKNDYFVYALTVYAENGKNYWDSFEEMKNDKLSAAYSKASVFAMEVVYDINIEFEKKLPENRWLKKYGFIDEELNYTDRKSGEKVDREGNPIKKLEDEAKANYDNLQGEIVEETPFLDDETNEPVVLAIST